MGELLGNYERLAARGIRPFRSINHGPTTSMYYVDPDGNRVELQIDNFATAEEGQAWMLSPAFDRNPIGVEFEPDDLVRRFHAGVPVAELVIRDWGDGSGHRTPLQPRPGGGRAAQSAAATIHAELAALPAPVLEFHPADGRVVREGGARPPRSSARSAASRAGSASS